MPAYLLGQVPPAARHEEENLQKSFSPDAVHAMSDSMLGHYLTVFRLRMYAPDLSEMEAFGIEGNLHIMHSEMLRRSVGLERVVDDVPRPAGLAGSGGFALQPAPELPPAVAAAIPEGQLVDFPAAASAMLPEPARPQAPPQVCSRNESAGFTPAPPGSAAQPSSPPAADISRMGVSQVTVPLGAASYTLNSTINTQLMRNGLASAGEFAIGLVGEPQLFTRGARIPETLAHLGDAWGHTAAYVRQGGQITSVRGFHPGPLLETLLKFRSIEQGKTAVSSAIGADAYLLTLNGARTIEYAVTPELAAQFARGLPDVGPVPAGSGIPEFYTARPSGYAGQGNVSNCVLWAVNEAEQALGGPIGPAGEGSITGLARGGAEAVPNTASQGKLIKFMSQAAEGHPVSLPPMALGPAVLGKVPRYIKVLKWGGKIFFVVGLASVPFETYFAPEGERARTFVGAGSGFAAGLAAGSAAGLICGPGAPVCSVVLGLTLGVAGALMGRAAAEAMFDAIEALADSPGSVFAPPMATTLALHGGFGGLLNDPAREQRAMAARAQEQRMMLLRRKLLGP